MLPKEVMWVISKYQFSINPFKILKTALLLWVTPGWEIISVFYFRFSLMRAILQLCPLSQQSYLNSYKSPLRKYGFSSLDTFRMS